MTEEKRYIGQIKAKYQIPDIKRTKYFSLTDFTNNNKKLKTSVETFFKNVTFNDANVGCFKQIWSNYVESGKYRLVSAKEHIENKTYIILIRKMTSLGPVSIMPGFISDMKREHHKTHFTLNNFRYSIDHNNILIIPYTDAQLKMMQIERLI